MPPPKPKKPKAKPKPKVVKDKSVKAIARTKRGAAQAQTTKVVVKIGETKKPARRRRAPAKPKVPPPQPPPPDGWYPPQNLTRSGATFGAETIRYVEATPTPTPAQSNLFAGAPTPPSTLVTQSGMDAAFAPAIVPKTPAQAPELDWTDVEEVPAQPSLTWTPQTPFIRPSISGRQFVEAASPEPTFAPEARKEKTFVPMFEEEPEPVVEEPVEPLSAPLAILPSQGQVPEFNLTGKKGRVDAIKWYFNNMKAPDQSVLPQSTRSNIIRKALRDMNSSKAENEKVGIDKLNEQEQNAVLSILKRINAGETIMFP